MAKVYAVLGLFCSILASINGEDIITKAPTDVVALVGDTITLRCSAEFISLAFVWAREVHNEKGSETIFFTFNGNTNPTITDPDKFAIHGEYDLEVKSLTLNDAGRYTCKLEPSATEKHIVNVIVVEPPSIASQTDLIQGHSYEFVCEARFGAPRSDQIPEEQMPQFRMLFGQNSIAGGVKELEEGTPGVIWWRVREVWNHTIHEHFSHESVTCELFTTTPAFRISETKQLTIKRPVSEIWLEPHSSEYKAGEEIKCIADGSPEPHISWKAIKSNGPKPVTTAILTIEEDMEGSNEWTCTATNTVHDLPVIVELTHEFTVVVDKTDDGGDDPDQQPSTSSASGGVIAVAVIIPLVVIIGCIAAVLYMRKKKKVPTATLR